MLVRNMIIAKGKIYQMPKTSTIFAAIAGAIEPIALKGRKKMAYAIPLLDFGEKRATREVVTGMVLLLKYP